MGEMRNFILTLTGLQESGSAWPGLLFFFLPLALQQLQPVEPAHQPIQAFGDHIPGQEILAYIAAAWLWHHLAPASGPGRTR